MDEYENDFERADALQNLLIDHATGARGDDKEFEKLRSFFVKNPETKGVIPEFVRTCRTLSQFWSFIQPKFSSYKERRSFIYSEFVKLLDFLEGKTPVSADNVISETLRSFDEGSVHLAWSRSIDRRTSDPEGAITAARTLLETVCKHILDDMGIAYAKNIELSELYKKTAKELKLSPDQQTEDVFKQILGGCSGIISGLGQMRNKLSDAHGKGKKHGSR